MASALTKFFIIMTLAFEVLTITTGSAFYTIFAVVSAFAFVCIISQFAVARIIKMLSAKNRERNAFSHA